MKSLVRFDLTKIPKYSYSKLSNFEKCPLLFYKQYIEKDRNGIQNGFAEAGKVAHSIIEDYYKGEIFDFELPSEFLKRWENNFLSKDFRVLLKVDSFEKDLTDNYRETFYNYFKNFKAYEDCEVLDVELRFEMLLNVKDKSFVFTGIIDAFAIDKDGEYIIWDSKSKSKWKSKNEIDEYLKQLYVYSIFVKHAYGKYPKWLCFNQFRLSEKDRVTKVLFDESELQKTIDWMYETIVKIENEVLFLPKVDTFFCKNLCGFPNMNCLNNVAEVEYEY